MFNHPRRCYPDKIVFRSAPEDEGLQITWGRFVTKLLKLLEEHPEIEQGALDRPSAKTCLIILAASFRLYFPLLYLVKEKRQGVYKDPLPAHHGNRRS